MSSRTNNVILTLGYDDGTTRNIVFENVASGDLMAIKAKIKAINANINDEYANFYQMFVSNNGEPITGITACKIVATEEEVIYSG